MLIDRRALRNFDWMLLTFAIALPIVGLVVLFSAGYEPDSEPIFSFMGVLVQSQAFAKQTLFFILGFIAMFVVTLLSPKILMNVAYPFYSVCVTLLLIVDIIGLTVKGSQRWISLGFGFNLQPSEIMKVGLILALARYFSRNPPKGKSLSLGELMAPGAILLVPMALIAAQPDLGSALALGGVGAGMILFIGVRTKILVVLALLFLASMPVAWHQLHPYQQRRVLTLLNPEGDPRGSGYHITQSIIAVGSGELTGKGYMRGTQTQLEFLPEHTTDFVFCVLAEEWGFMGTMTVLLLYVGLIYRLLAVVMKARDHFSIMLAVGVATTFSVCAIINIAMVIGLLPVVGIPLPLLSYGGSAALTMMSLLGLALGVSVKRRVFQ
jgi:rod shape determining protein RodA